MNPKTVKICDLIDFGQCVFKGTVTSRRPLAQARNGKPWFSFIIEDDTMDVKVTVFTKAEELDKLIVVGCCYLFSNCQIRIKSDESRKFDHCRSDYEVEIKDTSIIEKVEGAIVKNTAQLISEVKQSALTKFNSDPTSIEICKLMVKVLSVQINQGTFNDKPWKRADLTIADVSDSTRISVFLNETGMQEADYMALQGTCVGMTGIIIKDREQYGPQFRTTRSTQIFKENELEEHFQGALQFIAQKDSISSAITSGNMGSPQNKEYSSFQNISQLTNTYEKSIVSLIFNNDAEKEVYTGCSVCKKKCDNSGALICGCDNAEPVGYYKLYGSVSDYTGAHAVTLFDPNASQIMGMTADQFLTMDPVLREKQLMKAYEVGIVMKLVPATGEQKERIMVAQCQEKIDYWSYIRQQVDTVVGADAMKLAM